MIAATQRRAHRLLWGVPILILIVALLTMVSVGLIGTLVAEEQLGETRAAKAAAVAEAVQYDLERALSLGIPLDRIEGISAYLNGIQGRNPDLGFLLVTGEDGAWMHGVAPFAVGHLTALVDSLRGLPSPSARTAALQPIARDGYLIVRLPLRRVAATGSSAEAAGAGARAGAGAGHVLVGVQPGEVRSQIAEDLLAVALGGAAVLLLLAQVAEALVEASVRAPLARLSRLMERAIAGDFGSLIGRRSPDAVGRVLRAFNAAVFSMHDRRQRFAAHAEEVRGAVFDPEVAQAVERTRAEALAALGDGLDRPPQRVADTGMDEVRAYAALVMAALVLVLILSQTSGAGSGTLILAVAGGVVVALGLARGLGARWHRVAASLAALGLALCAVLYLAGWSPGGWLAAGGWLSGRWLSALGLSGDGWLAGARAALAFGGGIGGVAVGLALVSARHQTVDVGGVARVLRAALAGAFAAGLWAVALEANGPSMMLSAATLAVLAAGLARPFAVARS
ncbi:methyl-accepting chemotaxis protein [Azospirillum griseum]|uniref:Methyl-accepting chemotaxis protein n=1 Tax=Azospirillum griseum TaxID=2496639 RepID=A0A431VBX0_9PROT|nr:methyl-accepting chemotaxis protein [Azospirillum griseum]RTR16146.1 methyl-accepting chemotaxis protein [Azospirillum griseum]